GGSPDARGVRRVLVHPHVVRRQGREPGNARGGRQAARADRQDADHRSPEQGLRARQEGARGAGPVGDDGQAQGNGARHVGVAERARDRRRSARAPRTDDRLCAHEQDRPALEQIGFLLSLLLPAALLAAGAPFQLQSPDGRRMVHAEEARTPIVVDGALDEEAWRLAEPADGFIQAEPHEGQAASEPTEVRILFDRDALYIGVSCHDAGASQLIVNDIRKDFVAGEQDSFEMILDTFADRRNGFVFVVNAAGAKSDAQIANEGRDVSTSWDAVWAVATTRNESGWTAEIGIPFKTLRFERGSDRVWGVNFSRRIRRKNEIDYWSPVPRVYNLYRASLGGTLW